MKTTATLLTATSALALIPFALSFGQGQSTPGMGVSLKQLYPGVYGSANFGKVLAGEFTGNLTRDALVTDGDRLYLSASPQSYDSRVTVSENVSDFAVLSGVLPGKDLIVTVSGLGLRLHERDSELLTWVVTTIRGPDTAWLNASKVCTGDLNGDGEQDLVGVAANNRDLLFEYGNGDGTFTSGTTVTVPNISLIREIATLNYIENGDLPGDDEVALSTNLGAAVFNVTNGTYPLVVTWTSSPIRNAAIMRMGSVTERLASVAFFNGQDRLVVRGTAGVVEPTVNLGNLGVVAVSSGDADNDGDSELFLSCNTDRKFRVALNASPATSTFTAGTITSYTYGHLGRDPALNDSNLAISDFDSDGYVDVLAPAQGSGSNPTWVHGTLEIVQLGFGNPALLKPSVTHVLYKQLLGSTPDKLRFDLAPPATLLNDQGGTNQRFLRARIYESSSLGGPTGVSPIKEVSFVMPASGTTVPLWLELPADYFPYTSSTLSFSLVLVQEVRNAADELVAQGPHETGIFSAEGQYQTVTLAPETHLAFATDRENESIPPSGGFDLGPDVPPYDDELEPKDDPKP